MYLYEALENSILGSAFQKSAIKLKCKINCYICNILYGLQKFYKNIDSDKIGFYQKHQRYFLIYNRLFPTHYLSLRLESNFTRESINKGLNAVNHPSNM